MISIGPWRREEPLESISGTIVSLIGPNLHHRLQIQTDRFQKVWISKIDDKQHLVSILDWLSSQQRPQKTLNAKDLRNGFAKLK